MSYCLFLLFLFSATTTVIQAKPPHIFFVLADDVGWGDVGFHRPQPYPEIMTPNMDALVADGIKLMRHYVYKFCTPTRSSMQSGRLPVHVTTSLVNPEKPNCGIPRNMTGIAAKLKQAGYKTHLFGKWDAGMATPHHTPQGRGYDTSLNYFTHKNDLWTQVEQQSSCSPKLGIVDLWATDKPANTLNGTMYEEDMFLNEMTNVIKNHNPDDPLFLVYTPHASHVPYQVPQKYYDKFSFIQNDETVCSAQTAYIYPGSTHNISCRRVYHAFVNVLDDILGDVVGKLKAAGLWEDTLMVFSADNGAPLVLAETGGNNHPLRGGKYSEWEGGIRSAAFVSGGYLPKAVRGTEQGEPVHVADWYGTFCKMAGVDQHDAPAVASGLPDVDSVDVWPLISGQTKVSPRSELVVNENALIQGDYKLLVNKIGFATWTGPQFPNATSPTHAPAKFEKDCKDGCLYNVASDPYEHTDLASSMPEKVKTMISRLDELKKGFYNNDEKGVDSCPSGIDMQCACWMAMNHYGGFFGPFQEIQL